MKLIALNLPRSFTEDELAKLFKEYGNIKNCSLVLDETSGKSKGFGFIEMALEHQGLDAMKQLHGSKIDKVKIRVKQAD
jgi:RNA recognition motif-containing protein